MRLNILFIRLLCIIALSLAVMPLQAQDNQQYAVFNYCNDGRFNAFLNFEIDSITYSCIDTLGIEHDEVVVQEVWTPDSLYRIPLNAIDSLAFHAPSPKMRDNLFYIREYHIEHALSLDSLTISFSSAIDNDSLPSIGQVMLCLTEKSPFEEGFAGRVSEINHIGDHIDVVCVQVNPCDVFERLVMVGTAVTNIDDYESQANARRSDYWGELESNGVEVIDLPDEFKDEWKLSILDLFSITSKKPVIRFKHSVLVNSCDYFIVCDAWIDHPDLTYKLTFDWDKISKLGKEYEEFKAIWKLLKDGDFNSIRKKDMDKLLEEKQWEMKIPIPFVVGPLNCVFEIGGMLKPEAINVKVGLEMNTSAHQHIGFQMSGYTNKLAKMYDTFAFSPEYIYDKCDIDGTYTWNEDPCTGFKADVQIDGSLSFGVFARLKVSLLTQYLVRGTIGAEYGIKLSYTGDFCIYDSDCDVPNIYGLLKDTNVGAKKYVKLKAEVGALPFNLINLSGEEEIPIWEKKFYLFPHFTAPTLTTDLGRNRMQNETFTSTVSKDILPLLSCKPGLAFFENGWSGWNSMKSMEASHFDQEPYKYDKEKQCCPEHDIQLSAYGTNLEPGRTYRCYPVFTMYGGVWQAGPYTEFTYPYPLSLENRSLLLKKDDIRLVRISGGWGNYSLDCEPKDVVKAEIMTSGNLSQVRITPLKEGTVTVYVQDKRSLETETIEIKVFGNQVEGAAITVSDDEIDFGDMAYGEVATKKFKVTNHGTADLHFYIDGPTNNKGFVVEGAGEPKHLKPGGSMTFNVTAKGIGPDLYRWATFYIISTATKDPVPVSMKVKGTAPPIRFVDLGLSVKWAECNLGALEVFERPGDYFAWGETDSKSIYDWNTYSHCDGTANTCYPLGDIAATDNDAAHTLWGEKWRLPTAKEFEELKEKCTWTWDPSLQMVGRLVGYNVTGPNGQSIFLEAAGYLEGANVNGYNNGGVYLSSTPSSDHQNAAYFLAFEKGDYEVCESARYIGASVRPVYDEGGYEPTSTEAYAVYNDGILTFYYDENMKSRGGKTISNGESVWWSDYATDITKVIFDTSFASYKSLTSTFKWFEECRGLTNIMGMENLNTDNVTNMSSMFSVCISLTSLDLSHFDTGSVTNMEGMFYGCSGLTTIYCSNAWNTGAKSANMFNKCTNLVGGKGTKYDSNHTNAEYARIDGGPERPGYFTDINAIQQEQPAEAIDLGLPSGIRWASYNVGATKPEEFGGKYAWGETEEKSEYTLENYNYNGIDIGSDISGTQYDVAHVKWGDNWQMPTKKQIEELLNKCTYEVIDKNSVLGMKFTGPNGNSIFLPFTENHLNDSFDGLAARESLHHPKATSAEETGILYKYSNYWSGTLSTKDKNCSHCLYLSSQQYDTLRFSYSSRQFGYSIRPVNVSQMTPPSISISPEEEMDFGVVKLGTDKTKSLTVTNTSNHEVKVTLDASTQFTYHFEVSDNQTEIVLMPGESKVYTVTAHGMAAGYYSSTNLIITTNSGEISKVKLLSVGDDDQPLIDKNSLILAVGEKSSIKLKPSAYIEQTDDDTGIVNGVGGGPGQSHHLDDGHDSYTSDRVSGLTYTALKPGVVHITFKDKNSDQMEVLTITVIDGSTSDVISVTPTEIDFGMVEFETYSGNSYSESRYLTVQNNGDKNVTLSIRKESVSGFKPLNIDVTIGGRYYRPDYVKFSLQPGQHQQIGLILRARKEGEFRGNVIITSEELEGWECVVPVKARCVEHQKDSSFHLSTNSVEMYVNDDEIVEIHNGSGDYEIINDHPDIVESDINGSHVAHNSRPLFEPGEQEAGSIGDVWWITGKKVGHAILKLKDKKTNEVLTLNVEVKQAPPLSLSASSVEMTVGEENMSIEIKAGSNWYDITSDNPNVATAEKAYNSVSWIDENGVAHSGIFVNIKGLKAGNATIKVRDFSSGDVIEINVTVKGANIPTKDESLIAYYPFNGNANDESGNENNGTPTESVTLTTGLHGDADGAYLFGGVDNPGCIFVPNSNTLKFSDAATFSAHFKPTNWKSMDGWGSGVSSGGWQCVFAKKSDSYGWSFILNGDDNGLSLHGGNLHNHWGDIGTDSQLPGNYLKWTHVAVVFGNGYARLYVDGQLVNERETTVNFSEMNTADLYIGKFSSSWYPFNGIIDEVRIYNRALSSEEVKKLAQYASAPDTPADLQIDTQSLDMTVGEKSSLAITSGNGSYDVINSNESVVSAKIEGEVVMIEALSPGTAEITVKDNKTGQKSTVVVTVNKGDTSLYITCPDNHHPHIIDLGLPSGTKWACCNVGADTPEAYGCHYAWGETEEKEDYNWHTYTL